MLQQLPQDTLGSSALAVKVNVLPANPPDGSLRPAIDNIESVRSSEEKDMFDSVRSWACMESRTSVTFL
jgi:hypothetical protein